MKLKKLEITNFRCFESLSIDLDGQLTVLVAKNGQGKSSVLDAIRIGLWSFVGAFDLARNPVSEEEGLVRRLRIIKEKELMEEFPDLIEFSDIEEEQERLSDSMYNVRIDDVLILKDHYGQMIRQLPCKIALKVSWDPWDIADKYWQLSGLDSLSLNLNELPQWTRFRESEDQGTKTKDDSVSFQIKHFASFLQTQTRNLESPDIDLPVISYYGTGRLWNQKRLTERKSKQGTDFYMRLCGYRDCLDPASSYKHFADWFTWVFECYREQQLNDKEKGVQEDASIWKDTIQIIQGVTNTLLQETGWHSLEYSVSHGKTLILKHDEHGTLKVELLSDGIRNVLGLVGDIAYRCIKLNPHLGLNAAKEARGVVMIDEVEMHLHPAWQQTILGNLCKAFPKIQFIVTTHSPQVISTVPSHQIRILAENRVISADPGTQGAEASRILNEVFGVELRAQNLEIVQKLNRYLELIDNDKWDTEEALTLRQALDEWSRGNEPELVKADIDIRMKAFQRQL